MNIAAAAAKTQCQTISAMEKLLPGKAPTVLEDRGTVLKNEVHHFQVALRCDQGPWAIFGLRAEAEGDLAPYVSFTIAELVPALVTVCNADDYYLAKDPALIPDPLLPFSAVGLSIPYGQWKGLWVTVKAEAGLPVGTHEIKINIITAANELLAQTSYTLEVLDAALPETNLYTTGWMHYDCIAYQHKVEMFSEAFYGIFDAYIRAYVDGGYNMLLTPLFTPPLDTKVGSERMTAQLVGVTKTEGGYAFDFSKLKTFIDFVLPRGIKYLEFSHLFTQWGGEHCPKVMAQTEEGEKRIFGWEDDATSPAYLYFLEEMFAALTAFLEKEGVLDISFFHLTDEPGDKHIESYKKCHDAVKKHVKGRPLMDAMSEYSFYEKGLVDVPVVAIHCAENYTDHGVNDIWVYNCCSPSDRYYTNRFINMPAERTRVMGVQMYQSGVKGYLHWGFNFYNSVLSIMPINPYEDTGAGRYFPSGDAFVVYPKEDGVSESIRYCMMQEAFQDYRALSLLESYIGREEVLSLLTRHGYLGYRDYPHSAEALRALRQEVNSLIARYAAT